MSKTIVQKLKLFILLSILLAIGYVYRIPLWEIISECYYFILDRENLKAFINSFGYGAPLVFILLQILQVLFAPVPGELSGVIGGYLFGTFFGFILSSVGLTIGSWINFMIGRLLGKSFVKKLIPSKHFDKLNTLVKPKGIVIVFLLFLFPGFPKDYLCLFLGLSNIPVKIFIIMSGIGRMPGTFMLSLQGAALFDKTYGLFVIVLGLCIFLGFLAYRFRENLYQWIERVNND